MKNRGLAQNIGGTPDAGNPGWKGVIGGIVGIGPGAPVRAHALFFSRAHNNFSRAHRKDTPDTHDDDRPMRLPGIGGTPDVLPIPPMTGFCPVFQP